MEDQQSNDNKSAHGSTRKSGGAEVIQAVQFVPSDDRASKTQIGPWHIAIGIFLLLALFAFWFLLTSKSVQINFSPAAQSVDVDGGLVIELGGVYLLREGSYNISAVSDLHVPLNESVEVGAQRNQSISFAFTPLPGFLALDASPGDATVRIDGRLLDAEQPIELDAGQHELQVSHPRYLEQVQIIDIQGKRITQDLAISLEPNWAEVSIASTPAGAEVWIDDAFADVTTPATIEALAGEREISIRLTGFKTHRERIFAQAGIAMKLNQVDLVQADAQLDITSQPKGAGVTVNGRFAGQTPVLLDLKSGQAHKIAVISNGYATFTKTIRLKRGEQASLRAPLVRQLGEVVVISQPDGAQLNVDGKAMGAANRKLMLPTKPHELEITLAGHAGYKQTVTPKVGLTQEIKVKLLSFAEARLQALKPNITSAAGQNLKLFEPYAFTLGASRREPGRRANETLRQADMTKLFYLATQEVTNGQFRQFASGHDSGMFEEISLNDDDLPVSSVSWDEAAAYCNWLSDADGLPQFYNIEFGKVVSTNPASTGYRLPTEAEWAWAARALPRDLAESQAQLRFPWGDNLPPPDRHGNYADRAASALVGRVIFGYNDNHTAAAPVGTFKPNHRGLFDLGGNVSEWMNDFYEIPGRDAVVDPVGPASGDYHVIRGSSWKHGTITELRFSFRDYGTAGRQDLGFRIARNTE